MATFLATFVSREAGVFALARVRRAFDAIGLLIDSACAGLDSIELRAHAPHGDSQLAAEAREVANTLATAGLRVSAAQALDQLRRIAVAADRLAVIAAVREAMRHLDDSACHAPRALPDEAGGDPDLVPDA